MLEWIVIYPSGWNHTPELNKGEVLGREEQKTPKMANRAVNRSHSETTIIAAPNLASSLGVHN